jgi:glycogen(starch) synthase
MKIALISYEFPPETGYGGIGTYTYQISKTLAARGHHIEVFSSSPNKETLDIEIENGVMLHRVKADKRAVFSEGIVEVFRKRNAIIGFDLIESPEYCAEGMAIQKEFSEIPMVVKLHAPLFLIKDLNNRYKKKSIKSIIKKYTGRSKYHKISDRDYIFTSSANAVCSPSKALASVVKEKWGIRNIDIVPNVFIPSSSYLSLPVESSSNRICFIGKLNVLKGIRALTEAIPLVFKKNPDAKFRFIGRDGESPDGLGSMKEYIIKTLNKCTANLEFTDYVVHDEIPRFLADTDLVVLPSLWENYPYTCLEAMSAGKAVVGSQNGGMKEILHHGKGGFLINPRKPGEIASAITWLLSHPDKRKEMGFYNRKQTERNAEVSLNRAEQYYSKLIAAAKTNPVT